MLDPSLVGFTISGKTNLYFFIILLRLTSASLITTDLAVRILFLLKIFLEIFFIHTFH